MLKSQDFRSYDLPISSTLRYNSAIPWYQISISFLKEKRPTRLRSTTFLREHLQNIAFLASHGWVEKNSLQLKTTENQWW